MPTERLEELLLEKHSTMRYAEAKSLVIESRRHLKMSRIQPWDDRLLQECERRWTTTQIADTDEDAMKLMEDSKTPKETSNVESEHTNSTSTTETENSSSEEEDKGMSSPIVEVTNVPESIEKEAESEIHLGEEKAEQVLPEVEQQPEDVVEEEIHDDDDCDDEEDVENEDNYSQASDHSQCFTTAEEAGISKAAIAAAIAEAEKAEADDLKFVESNKSPNKVPQDAKKSQKKLAISFESAAERPPVTTNGRKAIIVAEKNLMEDHITIDTAENSELSGIPTIIYIRKDGKCEVPANEPLGESYNIPLPLLLANAKKGRVRKLREKVVRRLRRWGLYRREKTRLEENDHEVHFQTLVDL